MRFLEQAVMHAPPTYGPPDAVVDLLPEKIYSYLSDAIRKHHSP
jgi:hypothetical protein